MLFARVAAFNARAFLSPPMRMRGDGRARRAVVFGDVAHATRQPDLMPRIVAELVMIEIVRSFRKPA